MKDTILLIVFLLAFPLGALALALSLGTPVSVYSQVEMPFSPWVDPRGNIELPEDFREHWTHLGSFYVEGSGGGDEGATFHDVYTEPESARYFRDHEAFPDGATLVKEVRSSHVDKLTTGRAHWADETSIWFVMVKDAKGRFEGNPLWGDGWGWALFEADDPSRTVTQDYTTECRTCHVPAQQTDWVYVQGYPTLGLAPEPPTSPAAVPMAASPADPASGAVVTIENLEFTPNVIRLEPGQAVTWVNRDEYPHTATANDGSFDTGTFEPGASSQIVFEKPGSYPYYCTPHPFMTATIIVGGDDGVERTTR